MSESSIGRRVRLHDSLDRTQPLGPNGELRGSARLLRDWCDVCGAFERRSAVYLGSGFDGVRFAFRDERCEGPVCKGLRDSE